MIRALYTSASGMKAQETNIDVISNNLANVNTVGFKKSTPSFQDLFYQTIVEPGAPTSSTTSNPTGIQVGLGVKTSSVQKIFTQGDLQSTNNPLDLAIEGDGFFQVQMPDGSTAFTRSGSFRLSSEGQIVTADGYTLDPGISIPSDATKITVARNGDVAVQTPGATAATVVGTITAVRFPNNSGLSALGQNLFAETESSGAAITGTYGENGFGRLSQGFLESSNVSVVEQVVNMITAQRAYEASSKGINAADEMLTQAINVKR